MLALKKEKVELLGKQCCRQIVIIDMSSLHNMPSKKCWEDLGLSSQHHDNFQVHAQQVLFKILIPKC